MQHMTRRLGQCSPCCICRHRGMRFELEHLSLPDTRHIHRSRCCCNYPPRSHCTYPLTLRTNLARICLLGIACKDLYSVVNTLGQINNNTAGMACASRRTGSVCRFVLPRLACGTRGSNWWDARSPGTPCLPWRTPGACKRTALIAH